MSYQPTAGSIPSIGLVRNKPLNHAGTIKARSIKAFAAIGMWIVRRRLRKALGELVEENEHLLKDIGLSREEALRNATKPFWRE